MRNVKWLIAAVLVIPTTGCVEFDATRATATMTATITASRLFERLLLRRAAATTQHAGYYATPSVNNYYYTPRRRS